MSYTIFCPTLPQSGTWTTLRFLERCGYKIRFTGAMLTGTEDKVLDQSTPTVFRTHIFPFYYQGNDFKETLPSYGDKAKKDYVVREHHLSMGGIEVLAGLYKTIIPIRDPLACLLTRENRAPQLRHYYITDGFMEVINRFKDHPNVFFFPVDLYSDVLSRDRLVAKTMKHCEILTDRNTLDAREDMVKNWGRENCTTNRFREPYEQGDIKKIEEMLGSKMGELEHLRHFAGHIKPFLRSLGYQHFIW